MPRPSVSLSRAGREFAPLFGLASGHLQIGLCPVLEWSGRAPATPATNLARGSKDKGARHVPEPQQRSCRWVSTLMEATRPPFWSRPTKTAAAIGDSRACSNATHRRIGNSQLGLCPVLEWSGRAPATPATEFGKGLQRQRSTPCPRTSTAQLPLGLNIDGSDPLAVPAPGPRKTARRSEIAELVPTQHIDGSAALNCRRSP